MNSDQEKFEQSRAAYYQQTDRSILDHIESELLPKEQSPQQGENQVQEVEIGDGRNFFQEDSGPDYYIRQGDLSPSINSSIESQEESVNPGIFSYTRDDERLQNIYPSIRPDNPFSQVFYDSNKGNKLKNGNIPKFTNRIFLQEAERYMNQFEQDIEIQNEIRSLIRREKLALKSNKNKNNKLSDIIRLFGSIRNCRSSVRKSFLMRKVLNKILRSHLTENVILNPQIKLRKEYLVSLKVQSLRCRNISLLSRLESK